VKHLAWVRELRVRDLRNIREAAVELHPGLNVFSGSNAQGKTSLLEAVGIVARGRSFRTEDPPTMIRRGAARLFAGGETAEGDEAVALAVEIRAEGREYRVDGRAVPPRDYHGRLEAVVYSTERLRVVRGTMRDRRQHLDRAGAALWPAYRAEVRDFERILAQRNAALAARSNDLDAWTERFVDAGARLRSRRAAYAARLTEALRDGFRPAGETYEVRAEASGAGPAQTRAALEAELEAVRGRERAAGRSLAGPHRDPVALLVDGRDAALGASAGQVRSLLLALTLAALRVYQEETGRAAVALLDDLDSELDAERAGTLCAEIARRGQALVTSAHPGWAETLRPLGRIYHVSAGAVRCA
jgi:DNA replication and repair protein RecF